MWVARTMPSRSEAPNRRAYPVAERTSTLRVPGGSGGRRSASATPDQRLVLYQPDVQSSAHTTEVWRRPASRSAVHDVATARGVVSSSHEVGTGVARGSDPVAARGAPSVCSNASFAATPTATTAVPRRNAGG